jgi:DNA-directed RNA polymerase specialized sigma24 family protein
MSDVTRILSRIDSGDPAAAEQLLPLVYDELRKLAAARLAQERPGQTLQATALVHEAYLRLVGGEVGGQRSEVGNQKLNESTDRPTSDLRSLTSGPSFHSRGHFFAAAAEAMRRILVENARRKRSLKGGGGMTRVDLEHAALAIDPEPDDLLALEEALTRLASEDAAAADLAKLRLFAGLTVDDAAAALGISRTTGFRHWTYARAFLQAEMKK